MLRDRKEGSRGEVLMIPFPFLEREGLHDRAEELLVVGIPPQGPASRIGFDVNFHDQSIVQDAHETESVSLRDDPSYNQTIGGLP